MEEPGNSGMHNSSVHLFGSCANGTASEESDVDIAIRSPDFPGVQFSKRFHLLGSALIRNIQKYQVPIDIIPLTTEEFEHEHSIRMGFIRQGVEVTIHPNQNSMRSVEV